MEFLRENKFLAVIAFLYAFNSLTNTLPSDIMLPLLGIATIVGFKMKVSRKRFAEALINTVVNIAKEKDKVKQEINQASSKNNNTSDN